MTQPIDLPERNTLTAAIAQRVTSAALEEAQRCGVRVSIAIVDDGGHLLHFVRMDGIHAASCEVAQAKARCAAMFRKPTREYADAVAGGRNALLALPGLVPFAGGVPLVGASGIVGAIGVSGAAPEVDDQIALAGASVLAA